MITRGLMSSATPEHYTPPSFLMTVERVGAVGLDPCWSPKSKVRAPQTCSPPADGLLAPWRVGDDELVFVNPPYGREIGAWTDKCAAAGADGQTVVALVPGRTDAAWFQRAARSSDLACLLRGRLRFWTDSWCDACGGYVACTRPAHAGRVTRRDEAGEALTPAPFPSVALLWSGNRAAQYRFCDAFSRVGIVASQMVEGA